jgi:large subunit ribosomal protein L10
MKKIGLIFKESSENLIKERIEDSSAVFILKYSGISGPQLSSLRQDLEGVKARFFVVRNSVARRSLKMTGRKAVFAKATGIELLLKAVEGPCGLIFVKEEPASVCKVLCNFSKVHEQIKIEAGFLNDRILEKKDIEMLSILPSREILRAQVVAALNSPLQRLVLALNATLTKFVYCLEQIKNKKAI